MELSLRVDLTSYPIHKMIDTEARQPTLNMMLLHPKIACI